MIFFSEQEEITPLMYTIFKRSIKASENLLNRGANVNNVSKYLKHTPLLIACSKKNISIIKLLIQRGADYTCTNILNRTCLINTIIGNNCDCNYTYHRKKESKIYEILKYLLEFDAVKKMINAQEYTKKCTVLIYAIKFGYCRIVKMLLQNNANPHVKCYNCIQLYNKKLKNFNELENDNDDNDDDIEMIDALFTLCTVSCYFIEKNEYLFKTLITYYNTCPEKISNAYLIYSTCWQEEENYYKTKALLYNDKNEYINKLPIEICNKFLGISNKYTCLVLKDYIKSLELTLI